MGTFLLALFIIFIVIPLCRVAWTIYKLRRDTRKAFNQFQSGMNNQSRERQRENRPAGWQTPHKEKKIDRSQGEYIEYEEISVTESSTTTTSDGETTGTIEETETNRRIVDVEWEDIR